MENPQTKEEKVKRAKQEIQDILVLDAYAKKNPNSFLAIHFEEIMEHEFDWQNEP